MTEAYHLLGRMARAAGRGRSRSAGADTRLVTIPCRLAEESLSAGVDGEATPVPPELVDAHLVACAPCRAYLAGSVALARRLRIQLLEPVPDLSPRIVAELGPGSSRGEGARARVARARRRLGALPSLWAIRWAVPIASLAVVVPVAAAGGAGHLGEVHVHLLGPCSLLLSHRPAVHR